jgi:hypothetical protein
MRVGPSTRAAPITAVWENASLSERLETIDEFARWSVFAVSYDAGISLAPVLRSPATVRESGSSGFDVEEGGTMHCKPAWLCGLLMLSAGSVLLPEATRAQQKAIVIDDAGVDNRGPCARESTTYSSSRLVDRRP